MSEENNVNDSVPQSTEYGVARVVCSFISFAGWVLAVVGVVILLMVLNYFGQYGGSDWPDLLPGLGVVVSGFLMIMGAQVTQATVDNADHTREILKEIRKKC